MKLLVALALLATGTSSASAQTTELPGETQTYTYSAGTATGTYQTYTPASLGRAVGPAPLVVLLHGCATTADMQQRLTALDAIAERERFMLLVPDQGTLGSAQCWDWYTAARGESDAAVVVGMVDEVKARVAIDPERVYVIGSSSGAMLTPVVAMSYPDVFAAAGIMAGIAYKDLGCPFTGVTLPADQLARQAYDAMGERRRVVPLINIGGDADTSVPPACQDNATAQFLLTNGKVLGQPLGTLKSVRKEQVPGGHSSTVTEYFDLERCRVVERWNVHGMGHLWSGGGAGPDERGLNDQKGPDGGEIAWRFFSRFRRSETGPPCAETKAASSPVACVTRSVLIKVPRTVRRVRVFAGGRRLEASVYTRRDGGRRVRVLLPASSEVRFDVVGRIGTRRYAKRLTRAGCA